MRARTKAERQRAAGALARRQLLGGAATMAILIVAYNMIPAAPVLDHELCPAGGPLTGHTILLIDKTDPHPYQQQEALRSWIAQLKDEIPSGERLSIRFITDDANSTASSIFARCNPGDGTGVSRIWANPDKIKKRWTESFDKPLMTALEKLLLSDQETSSSPILASIEHVMWDKGFGAHVPHRRLIILSDFLENVDHNQYRTLVSVPVFLKSDLGRRLKEKIWSNLRVDLGYLRNDNWHHRQGAEHIAFWRTLFENLGAKPVHVIPPFRLPAPAAQVKQEPGPRKSDPARSPRSSKSS
jgi:hypothetical protein